MLQSPDNLKPLSDSQKSLTDLLENANENYAEYYLLKAKFETWIQWYTTQKQIYEEAK